MEGTILSCEAREKKKEKTVACNKKFFVDLIWQEEVLEILPAAKCNVLNEHLERQTRTWTNSIPIVCCPLVINAQTMGRMLVILIFPNWSLRLKPYYESLNYSLILLICTKSG